MKHNKSSTQKNYGRIKKTLHYLSWFLIPVAIILIALRLLFPISFIFSYLDFAILFTILLDSIILNRISLSRGMRYEKAALATIIVFFIINFMWQIQGIAGNGEVIGYKHSFISPFLFVYALLALGLVLLAWNSGPLGKRMKELLLKLKEPASYTALTVLFLLLCCFFLLFQQDILAEKTAKIAYLLLVIGVVGQFIQNIILKKKKNA